ncbi:MAG: hypothetical protein KGJ30_18960 [Burkholderiales bacterium]|nr:hypothetical protein [Burkholderiales bacterium]MDE1928091.1 hypothetical protein [Burkholderiales bacterium]MDE2160998.1 hypothetical protein [Burkholderiales bacterium]
MKSFGRILRIAALTAFAVSLSGCCLLWPYDHDHGGRGDRGDREGHRGGYGHRD